jgi:hypothetical protein
MSDVRDMTREEFGKKFQESIEELKEDEGAWEEYQREIEIWDRTAADGLEYDPVYDEKVEDE